MEGPVTLEHEAALVGLLDDESVIVENALFAELKRLDGDGLRILRKVLSDGDALLQQRARHFLVRLEGPGPSEAFYEFIRASRQELERGVFLLNRVAKPELDITALERQLDLIAERALEAASEQMSIRDRCKVLNRVIFHEFGFRGNAEQVDDPRNTFIEHVLRRRKGIPISLSIVYLLVARRCGLNLEPVGIPGRFMVGCFSNDAPFYVDPYERGAFRCQEELVEFLRNNDISPLEAYLAPTSTSEVLCRCCRFLVRQYTVVNQATKARLFAAFVRAFDSASRGFPRT